MQQTVLLAVLVLAAGCSTTRGGYDGDPLPRPEVAVVHAHADDTRDPDARPGTEPPSSISVILVDGEPQDATRLELLPGRRRIRVQGERLEADPDRIEASRGDLEFDAVAGRAYRIVAVRSDRQPPWSYRLIDAVTRDEIASSEPSVDDLELSLVPRRAAKWPLVDWSKGADYEYATQLPPGETLDDWGRMFERERSELPGETLVTALQFRSVRARRLAGQSVATDELDGDGWIERWEFDVEGERRRGVTVHRVIDGELVSQTFVTRIAEGAEERCAEWEAALVAVD